MSEGTGYRHPIFQGVEMGTGTWAWGDRLYWGYGKGYAAEDLRAVYEMSLDAGICFFDTSEVYGQGRSETFLGEFSDAVGKDVVIGTKFMPFPWRLRRRSLIKALKKSLSRLNMNQLNLYQIHMPLPPITVETWMEAMIEAYQQQLVKAVGVSNYDRDQMQRAFDTLHKAGLPLASNQVEYNLLDRRAEKSGLLEKCKELGITMIAYSPLALGVLTGKYSAESLPQGMRSRRFSRKVLEDIKPLISILREIGAHHAGKTPAQVALNWVICKGAVPIPGAKTPQQIEQNAGALGWKLTEEEIALLDKISEQVGQGQ